MEAINGEFSIKKETIISDENKCADVYRHPRNLGVFVYVCRICNKQFEKATEFEEHLIYHCPYQNEVKVEHDVYGLCDVGFNDGDGLNSDYDDVATDDPVISDAELKAIPPIDVLHLKIESTKKKRKAKVKSEGSVPKVRVPGHRLCKECNEQIPANEFKKHQQNIHNPWLFCDFCGHKSKLKGNLQTHIISRHTDLRPFKCDECGKSFRTNAYYAIHQRIHRGEPTDQCHFCGKSFYGTNNYKEHLKQHHLNQKRSYPCKQCDKKYTKSEKLLIHIRAVHTGERPFVCTVCGKAFAAARYLRQHNNIHFEEKQFKCKYCGLAFAQKVGRRAHERGLHEKHMLL